MTRKCHVRFGGGRAEKAALTDLAVRLPNHELAHALEHFREERQEAPRDQRELEAESSAMVVCALLGIPHPTARDYILMYRGDAEGLKASLSAIRRIVGRMVDLLGLALSANENVAPLAAD